VTTADELRKIAKNSTVNGILKECRIAAEDGQFSAQFLIWITGEQQDELVELGFKVITTYSNSQAVTEISWELPQT
jgi:hypothetical protein